MVINSSNIKYFLRLFIGLGILCLLVSTVDFSKFPPLANLSPIYFGIATLLVFVDRFISVYRWSLLINVKGMSVRFSKILSIYFISSYVGLIMPSSVGGEFLKGYGLSKTTAKAVDSYSSVIIERLLGLFSLICVCLGSIFLFPEMFDSININFTVGPSFIKTAAIGILACFLIFLILRRIKGKNINRAAALIKKILLSFYDYRKEKKRLFSAFFLSILIQIVRIMFAWSVARGLGISTNISYFFFYIPIIAVISMIPVSLAGLGIQEGAFVYFFTASGAASSYALYMAIIVRILTLVSVLPGAWLWIKRGL